MGKILEREGVVEYAAHLRQDDLPLLAELLNLLHVIIAVNGYSPATIVDAFSRSVGVIFDQELIQPVPVGTHQGINTIHQRCRQLGTHAALAVRYIPTQLVLITLDEFLHLSAIEFRCLCRVLQPKRILFGF